MIEKARDALCIQAFQGIPKIRALFLSSRATHLPLVVEVPQLDKPAARCKVLLVKFAAFSLDLAFIFASAFRVAIAFHLAIAFLVDRHVSNS